MHQENNVVISENIVNTRGTKTACQRRVNQTERASWVLAVVAFGHSSLNDDIDRLGIQKKRLGRITKTFCLIGFLGGTIQDRNEIM